MHYRFVAAILLNSAFVVFEMAYAFKAHSSSLFADAFHNLGDIAGLVLAGLAHRLHARIPTLYASFGFKKVSIFAAFLNALFLAFTAGFLVADAIDKWLHPEPVLALTVMWVAALGIVINGGCALFFREETHDLNINAAYLHLLYDALISLGVLITAALIYVTHLYWLDALSAIVIAVVILKGASGVLFESTRLMLDRVPKAVDMQAVASLLLAEPGIMEIHDLHIWAISTQENALSVHIRLEGVTQSFSLQQKLTNALMQTFKLQHVTLQFEQKGYQCPIQGADHRCVSFSKETLERQ